ncbi:envelope integrity protein Cei [Pseudonocardia spinosispora]|uniref:envelope integrity protein Cei n=1 Tax=Pseudonocardia spinosispora TaxID=103441 RepID=UPI00040B4E63|nr:envelope integrity protein Cei [Pseudonocardia spinosispora]
MTSGRAYRRRAVQPAAVLVSVLVVVVAVTWTYVFSNTTEGTSGAVCPPAAAGQADPGQSQPTTALDQVQPAPPSLVRIRVLNGGGQRGQANLVASQLGELGFTEAADPTNDPLYPNDNLTCRGSIRYGTAGVAAARTVSLVLPCVQLLKDNRPDDSVDVAVGTLFGDVNPSKAAKDALDQLSGPGSQSDTPGPSADPELLTKARDVRC